jgi:hypothetical protein
MSDGFDTLPDDVQAILRAERARLDVPTDARARLTQRLSVGVPGFGPPHAPAPTGAPPVGGALTSLTAKVLVALALGAGGAATLRGVDSRSSPRAHSQVTAVLAREIAPHAARTLIDEPDIALPAPPSPAPAKVRHPDPALAPPLTPSAALRQERRLLDLARDAIVRGEPAAALVPTASHAARFPRGMLAEERDALRIRALARLGRADEARALLAAMRTDHPRSFLLEGAAADVDSIP